MPCPRCTADPFRDVPGRHRPGEATTIQRICAFDGEGQFTPDNWCCLTLAMLAQYATPPLFDQHTSSLRVLPLDPSSDKGWLVLTAHGWKHKIVSAVHVGDHLPRPLTLQLAERTIAYYEARSAMLRARLAVTADVGRVVHG